MYTENTKIREIINLPGILRIVEKYTKKQMNMAMLRMGANLTIEKVGNYLKWNREQMRAVLEELNELRASADR